MATLEELQARITRLEDIKQIEKLQRIYGYYLDYSEYDKVVDLFSDDCDSVEVADFGVYKGKEGVRRFYKDLIGAKTPRPGELFIGLIMQGVVTVDPGATVGKGRWYSFNMEAKPTLSLHEGELRQLWSNGIYENEYVKENGKWYFKKVFYFLNFRTTFEDGWLKVPVVGQHGPSKDVPPDAPPTNYRPYPSGVHLTPHYNHPITGR